MTKTIISASDTEVRSHFVLWYLNEQCSRNQATAANWNDRAWGRAATPKEIPKTRNRQRSRKRNWTHTRHVAFQSWKTTLQRRPQLLLRPSQACPHGRKVHAWLLTDNIWMSSSAEWDDCFICFSKIQKKLERAMRKNWSDSSESSSMRPSI